MSTWAALALFWWHFPAAVPYSAPLPAFSGSIFRTTSTHLGLRPASDGSGAALTLQLTAAILSL